jgi:hypothetical protein
MDRKEFLKGCATGLCACAAACLPTGALAEPTKAEDWKLPFVQRRYAKLIGTLSKQLPPAEMAATMQELGAFCASEQDSKMEAFRGKPEAYIKEATKNGSVVTYDAATKTYTSSYDPKGDCFCPLNSMKAKTPGAVCECSVGWTKHTWGIVLNKEAKVVLKEAVLRGGKVCKVEVTAA